MQNHNLHTEPLTPAIKCARHNTGNCGNVNGGSYLEFEGPGRSAAAARWRTVQRHASGAEQRPVATPPTVADNLTRGATQPGPEPFTGLHITECTISFHQWIGQFFASAETNIAAVFYGKDYPAGRIILLFIRIWIFSSDAGQKHLLPEQRR